MKGPGGGKKATGQFGVGGKEEGSGLQRGGGGKKKKRGCPLQEKEKHAYTRRRNRREARFDYGRGKAYTYLGRKKKKGPLCVTKKGQKTFF